jgi:hypothetical protein
VPLHLLLVLLMPGHLLQLLLLRSRWHIILVGLAFQYVHGIFTQLAYRMHQPAAQPLHDVGFQLIPVSSTSTAVGNRCSRVEQQHLQHQSDCTAVAC